MHAPRNGDGPSKEPGAEGSPRSSAPGKVVAHGYIDTEAGPVPLAPSIPGDIAEVRAREGQIVRKGEILLRLDDRLARSKLAEAEAAIGAADGQVAEAEAGMKQFGFARRKADAAIEAAKLKYQAAKYKLADATSLRGVASRDDEIKALTKEVEFYAQAIEIADLDKLTVEASDPTPKLAQARANRAARVAIRDQARVACDLHELKAPADGRIERRFVHPGAPYSPLSRNPITFLFRENGPTIVRVELDTEFANRIAIDQPAIVVDQFNSNRTWRGKVTFIADSFLPKREAAGMGDAVNLNPTRVLEFQVTLDPDASNLPRYGQKVRVELGAMK
jgi:multidrug resistance efflux pump